MNWDKGAGHKLSVHGKYSKRLIREVAVSLKLIPLPGVGSLRVRPNTATGYVMEQVPQPPGSCFPL